MLKTQKIIHSSFTINIHYGDNFWCHPWLWQNSINPMNTNLIWLNCQVIFRLERLKSNWMHNFHWFQIPVPFFHLSPGYESWNRSAEGILWTLSAYYYLHHFFLIIYFIKNDEIFINTKQFRELCWFFKVCSKLFSEHGNCLSIQYIHKIEFLQNNQKWKQESFLTSLSYSTFTWGHFCHPCFRIKVLTYRYLQGGMSCNKKWG